MATTRTIGGVTYDLTFDEENRITAVKQGSTTIGSFVYDADGNRVKGTVNGVTTSYIAGLFEWQGGATTKYYDGGAIRRTGHASGNGISYVLGDQLGSTSVIVGQNGVAQAMNYYFPFGGNRGGAAFSDLTTKRFTGQYHEKDLPGGEGLSYYNARWYDPQLGRFASADTIVPSASNPQSYNRFSYALNNPTRFTDPTGHMQCDACGPDSGRPITKPPVQKPKPFWPPLFPMPKPRPTPRPAPIGPPSPTPKKPVPIVVPNVRQLVMGVQVVRQFELPGSRKCVKGICRALVTELGSKLGSGENVATLSYAYSEDFGAITLSGVQLELGKLSIPLTDSIEFPVDELGLSYQSPALVAAPTINGAKVTVSAVGGTSVYDASPAIYGGFQFEPSLETDISKGGGVVALKLVIWKQYQTVESWWSWGIPIPPKKLQLQPIPFLMQ
jgi:RHS repeat-associated protein